jgi:hypothetical protein
MRYCQRCGVPRTLTNEHKWSPNGTVSVTRGSHRMVFIDSDALNHTMVSIASRIGIPIEDTIVEAKRKSGKDFMDAVLSGVKGVVARNLISRTVYERLGNQINLLGLGHPEVTSYKRGTYLEGTIENAYSGPAITGDICGAFESVEGCAATATFDEDVNGTVKCFIKAAGSERASTDRFVYTPPPVLPGRNIYELCPVCKAPLALGKQYEFDADRGVIIDRKSGDRVVLIGVMTLADLFGELAMELGGEIPAMIAEIEKERVKAILLEKGKKLDNSEDGYFRYMKTLELKGMGNGRSVALSDGKVDVRVDNPYYEPLIAGFLAGFYEAVTSSESSVEWTSANAGYTDVTVRRA